MRIGRNGLVGAGCTTLLLLSVVACGGGGGPSRVASKPIPISTVRENGVWWLRCEEADRLFALGMPVAEPGDSADPAEWVSRIRSSMAERAFNALASTGRVPSEYFRDELRFVAEPSARGGHFSQELQTPSVQHPDLFDLGYIGEMRWAGRQAAFYGWGSSKLIGYSLGRAPDWGGAAETAVHPWTAAVMRQDQGTVGKRRWVRMLRERYDSADEAAKAYGVEASNWEDLARRTDWSALADDAAARADTQAFLEILAARWYSVWSQSARAYDQTDAMVLSDRLEGPTLPGWLYPVLTEWVDLIFVHWPSGAGDPETKLRAIYEGTGKPILVAAEARSVAEYEELLEQVATLPFVVGMFQERELAGEAERIAAANRRAEAQHASSAGSLP